MRDMRDDIGRRVNGDFRIENTEVKDPRGPGRGGSWILLGWGVRLRRKAGPLIKTPVGAK